MQTPSGIYSWGEAGSYFTHKTKIEINSEISTTRPFGAAVLDGVDLDIEGGSSAGYAAFVTQLRTHMDAADKT